MFGPLSHQTGVSIVVIAFYESHITNFFSIGSSIFKLWQVSSFLPIPFKATRKISTRGIKTKPRNGIDFCYLLHMCLGKAKMIMITMQSIDIFFKILAYCAEIALHVTKQNSSLENHENIQCLVHEATKQGCPMWYSDVTNPMELRVCQSELRFSSYGKFYLASQGHLGTPRKFQLGE